LSLLQKYVRHEVDCSSLHIYSFSLTLEDAQF
jgi:hypothetical protein